MANIATENFFKLLGSFGSWAPLIIVSIYFALIVYAFSRSGSAHFIVDKIWRLAGGEKSFKNQLVNDVWSDIRDVEAFRFRTRINVGTLSQIMEVENFLNKRGMSVNEIMPFAKYFDANSLRLRDINYKRHQIICFILAIFCYVLMSAPQAITSFTNFNYNKSVYLKLNESQKSVYLQRNKAYIDGNLIVSENCQNEKEYLVGKYLISKAEVIAICGELLSDNSEYYESTLKEQKYLVFFWTLLFVFLSIFFLRKAFSISKALSFHGKIDSWEKNKIKVKLLLK